MKIQRIRLLMSTVLLAALVVVAALPAAGSGGPLDKVRTTVDAIIDVLRQDLPADVKEAKISSMIKENFDLRTMSQGILATNWKKASDAEKVRFQDLFTQLIETTYSGRLDQYTYDNEEVKYLNEKIKGRKALVETVVVTSSAEIPVEYKLVNKGDGWLAYDVQVEGVSLIRTYRDSYKEIVKKEGMTGLLVKMEAKIEELRNEPPPDGKK
jgi:phospholipid transport system substrate-binding protein